MASALLVSVIAALFPPFKASFLKTSAISIFKVPPLL